MVLVESDKRHQVREEYAPRGPSRIPPSSTYVADRTAVFAISQVKGYETRRYR